MKLDNNRNIMLNMIMKKPDIGKTAVMKYTFFLQKAFGLKLGYPFGIYTYGPYSSDVSEDLDSLMSHNLIGLAEYPYGNSSGYKIRALAKREDIQKYAKLTADEEQKIDKVIELFGDRTARDLELISTILYFVDLRERIGNEHSEEFNIIENVKAIKPHFDDSEIEDELESLKELNRKSLFKCYFTALS